MRVSNLFLFAILLSCAGAARCQSLAQSSGDGFLGGWFERVSATQAEQPHWLAPIFTATPRLEDMFVYDIARQNTAKGDLTSFGGTKGLLLIPSENLNIVTTPPSYFAHANANIHDGFGDASFLLKYRIAASNEEQANYVVSAFLGASIPTGSHTNGARNPVVTPTIGFGKGWGNFDIQSTAGVGIPVGDAGRLGTPVMCNTAFQYRVVRQKLWPASDRSLRCYGRGRVVLVEVGPDS